jgi:hypothetical protein
MNVVANLQILTQRLRNWATDVGLHTAAVNDHLLNSRGSTEQGYCRCLVC